jgi:cytochrome c biogenesis factor
VTKNGKLVKTLEPRMNQYAMMREPIGSPDVYSTVAGDLYLSLLNLDPDTQRAGVTVITMPMVGWIWFAVIAMGLGGLFTLIPQYAGRRVTAAEPDAAIAAEHA